MGFWSNVFLAALKYQIDYKSYKRKSISLFTLLVSRFFVRFWAYSKSSNLSQSLTLNKLCCNVNVGDFWFIFSLRWESISDWITNSRNFCLLITNNFHVFIVSKCCSKLLLRGAPLDSLRKEPKNFRKRQSYYSSYEFLKSKSPLLWKKC